MVFGTAPPDFPAAPGGDVGWGEVAVEGLVPLVGQGREAGRQIVEAGQDFPVGAVGTAAVVPGAVGNAGLVAVAFWTAPPDAAVGAFGDLLRGQRAVFHGVPLGRQGGTAGGQVILPGLDFPAGTDGTACPLLDPRDDAGLPAVPLGTAPPDFSVRAAGDLAGRAGAVLDRVPLGRQERVLRRQRRLLRQDLTIGAVGTARPPHSCADHGLVCVALVTAPPGPLSAAAGDRLRGQRRVARRVPLGEQRLLVVRLAETE